MWIEVPKSIYTTATSNTDYTNIEKDMQTYASAYRQSGWTDTFYSTAQHGFSDSTEYNNWKNSMLESVFTNGGFYVGRYEMGTDTARIRQTDNLTTPLIQRDKYPYNYITCSQAQTLAKQLSTSGKQTSLMFGIQWDLILKYIETKGGKTQSEIKTDSITWGNYRNATFDLTRGKYLNVYTWNTITNYTKPESSALITTGATDRNSILGIYDLAGNVYEWTLEYYTANANYPCVKRGGSYNYGGSEFPASHHEFKSTNASMHITGCRPTLW